MIGLQISELGGEGGHGHGGGGKGGGKPAKGKDKDAPQFGEVREECKLYVDADLDIPLPLMARLIKFRLLIIKDTDIKNRKVCNVYSVCFGSVHVVVGLYKFKQLSAHQSSKCKCNSV